jgi:hypothetical protein
LDIRNGTHNIITNQNPKGIVLSEKGGKTPKLKGKTTTTTKKKKKKNSQRN